MRNTTSFRPTLRACEDRLAPSAVTASAVVLAPDDGGIPVVRVIEPSSGNDLTTINAYEDAFRGGVHAALGDVTGDGVRDIVIAPGEGGGPRVRIIDGKSGATLADFFVYESTFTGGVFVSVGDVNGDGRGDIVTGTGVGGGPRVRVLDGKTLGGKVLKDYFAYEHSFRGGVQVASGDINGDGTDDVIAGTGVGGGPRVQVFNGKDDKVLSNFFAYEDSFRGGVQVASGDVDGDGNDDVLVGSGVGGGPVVRAVSGADGRELNRFLADDSSFRGGVRVDSVDADGDGRADVVARTRRGNDDTVRVFDGRTGDFDRSVTRTVDDNPSADDPVERPAGGGTVTPGEPSEIEGFITALDAAAGTVQVRLGNGTFVALTAGPGTEIERNDRHTTLATFALGDKVEALVGPDGVAWKIESKTNRTGGSSGADDNSSSGGSGSDDGSDDGSGSGSGSTATETRYEGFVTVVDATAKTITLRLQSGSLVVVKTGTQTKIERNDRTATLAAFKVGDRGEARVGSNGVATKFEATGI